MKRFHFILLLSILLAACQAQPAASTTATPGSTPTLSAKATASKATSTPAAQATPTGSPIHSSSTNPNAPNLIVIRDQPIVKNTLTIDSVTAAQAGWVVLYVDKQHNGKDIMGTRIVYVAVPAGKSTNIVIALTENFNPNLTIDILRGNPVFAVLQAGPTAPGKWVQDNGDLVRVVFNVLASSKDNKPPLFPTATP
jgi:hypothetical protein